MQPRVIALVGVTAAGKTDLGEALADRLNAEVVCADSRQVFRELEIGTGKPDPETRAARPHHLFEALGLGEPASAGWYGRVAGETIAGILARGRPALLVGGSGLYLRALREGLSPMPAPDPAVRARLGAEWEALGGEALHARLARVDPETAARLAARDRQRVTRALEVFESSGRPLSAWHRRRGRSAVEDWIAFELRAPAATLRVRIARRAREMLERGLVEETRALVEAGLGERLRALHAIGYDEALELLAGRCDTDEARRRIEQRTAQLAKRQRTWFRHQLEAAALDGETAPHRLLDAALAVVTAAGSGAVH